MPSKARCQQACLLPVLSLPAESLSRVRLLATPQTEVCLAPLSMGFSKQEYCSGLPCRPPGDLPHPAIEPGSLMSPELAGGFFTTSTEWETP